MCRSRRDAMRSRAVVSSELSRFRATSDLSYRSFRVEVSGFSPPTARVARERRSKASLGSNSLIPEWCRFLLRNAREAVGGRRSTFAVGSAAPIGTEGIPARTVGTLAAVIAGRAAAAARGMTTGATSSAGAARAPSARVAASSASSAAQGGPGATEGPRVAACRMGARLASRAGAAPSSIRAAVRFLLSGEGRA